VTIAARSVGDWSYFFYLDQPNQLDVGEEATIGEDVEHYMQFVLAAIKQCLILKEAQNVPGARLPLTLAE
jgi:hypothetical protein